MQNNYNDHDPCDVKGHGIRHKTSVVLHTPRQDNTRKGGGTATTIIRVKSQGSEKEKNLRTNERRSEKE